MEENTAITETRPKGPPPRMTRAQVDEAIRSLKRLPKNPNSTRFCAKKEVLALLKPIVDELHTKKLYSIREIAAHIKERMTYIFSIKELAALIEDAKEETKPEDPAASPEAQEADETEQMSAGESAVEQDASPEQPECVEAGQCGEAPQECGEISMENGECGEHPSDPSPPQEYHCY